MTAPGADARKAIAKVAMVGAALEVLIAAAGFLMDGLWAAIAALVGASIATAAQVAAVALLRPAMGASQGTFQSRWAAGMAIRFGSLVVIAVLMVVLKDTLPPAWLAAGWLGNLLVLLFAEIRFLR